MPSTTLSKFSPLVALVTRNELLGLLRATAKGWRTDRVSRYASSLSFYALLSLVPLLVTFHAVFGLFMDQQLLANGLDAQVASFLGPDQARVVRDMLDHARAPSAATLQAVVGTVITFITAAGVFIELKDSMDAIWKVPKDERGGLKSWLWSYFAPMTMVLGFAFLLLISLLLDTLLSSAGTTLLHGHPALLALLASGNLIIGWLVAAILFAGIFRWLPTVKVAWRDVWLGAMITAALFVVGRLLIGMYLGRSDFTGNYGPAGAVVAIIVWIYYSAQILFTGAVFTREQAKRVHRWAAPEPPSSSPQMKPSWLQDGQKIHIP